MKIDTEQVIATYKDRIFAIGLTMLKNPDDAEDVVQETFLRYHTYKKDFESTTNSQKKDDTQNSKSKKHLQLLFLVVVFLPVSDCPPPVPVPEWSPSASEGWG